MARNMIPYSRMFEKFLTIGEKMAEGQLGQAFSRQIPVNPAKGVGFIKSSYIS